MNRPEQLKNDGERLTGPVFISYATEDRREALSLCAAIERRGTKCWWKRLRRRTRPSRFSETLRTCVFRPSASSLRLAPYRWISLPDDTGKPRLTRAGNSARGVADHALRRCDLSGEAARQRNWAASPPARVQPRQCEFPISLRLHIGPTEWSATNPFLQRSSRPRWFRREARIDSVPRYPEACTR